MLSYVIRLRFPRVDAFAKRLAGNFNAPYREIIEWGGICASQEAGAALLWVLGLRLKPCEVFKGDGHD
ncbi:MAG: hypothetical protein AUI91_12405 [Acidobacteria bacterium 13_1_40CM_3_56_11]|nr:MAG: hypothetical protein AUI91_12405 [Acidobacteria bacterium 13_1_40CM_3_56_11]